MFGKKKPRYNSAQAAMLPQGLMDQIGGMGAQMPIQGITGMIPQPTQPAQPQAQGRGMFQPPKRKRFSAERLGAALGSVGAMDGGAGIRQFDAHTDQQAQQQQQLARTQQLIQQATQGMSPQMAAAYGLNPQAAAAAQASALKTGQFQHGNRLATLGPNGMQSFDMGASNGDLINADKNDITSQNNLATQGLRGREIDESIRATDIDDANSDFSNQTGRMNAVTARDRAQYAASNPTSDLGKSPLYMTDADGNVQIGQLGNGQIVQAQTPQGMQILSPYDRGFQTSAGRTAGQAQGEAQGALPAALMRGEEALATVDKLLNHPGLEAGTGWDRFKTMIPGSDARAFGAMADQASGQAFLQGFEMLKGAGVITEFEGQRAEQALARMDRAQSADDYKDALRDYEGVVRRGMSIAQQRAGGEASLETDSVEGPQPGEVVDGYKFLGGDPADQNNWRR